MSRILPPLSALTQPYFDGCKLGQLRLQRCQDCDQFQFYPRVLCSHCGGQKLAWERVRGTGVIASYTVVHRAISAAYTAPYIVALIDLAEGSRMMSAIVGADPHRVAIGLPVTVEFDAWSEAISLPVFKLTEEE